MAARKKKVNRRGPGGEWVTVEEDMSAEEESAIDSLEMTDIRDRTAQAVAAAVRTTATGYAQGRLAAIESYDDLRSLALVVGMMKTPIATLTIDGAALKDIADYAAGRVAWALSPSRTVDELAAYDPVLDGSFPS